MTFFETLSGLNIEQSVSNSLLATSADVKHVLSKSTLSIDDFATLLSPAAETYLEEIAQKAHHLTLQRFGRTMQLFVPLYLSNECFNNCTYCGFSMKFNYARKTLTDEEMIAEAKHLADKGFKHLLILTGESPKKVGTDYIEHAIRLLKPYFSSIAIEVQPLEQSEYERLIEAGCDSLTIYQETYHPESYKTYHVSGKKRRFDYRLETPERGARAGMYRINVGALFGLYEWRYEALVLAHHVHYLMKHHWQSKYSVSFPRIRDMIGPFTPAYEVPDTALVQLITAFRLLFPDLGITLSTREPAHLRDNLIKLGVTQVSAESNTSPGGYSLDSEAEEQFSISDTRDLAAITSLLQKSGYEAVMKDWETV